MMIAEGKSFQIAPEKPSFEPNLSVSIRLTNTMVNYFDQNRFASE